MAEFKRETAIKCHIKDLLDGRFIKREGWEPSYIETKRGNISRVNIIGAIIKKEGEVLILDDGTGQIIIRSFEQDNKIAKTNVGEIQLIIGRPREFGDEKYIVPEIIKKIENSSWIMYRKLELQDETGPVVENKITITEETSEDKPVETEKISQDEKPESEPVKTAEQPKTQESVEVEDNKIISTSETKEVLSKPVKKIEIEEAKIDIVDSVLQKISELDAGVGVKIEDIIKHFEKESANATINKLIEQGDIFEVKPGIVKVL